MSFRSELTVFVWASALLPTPCPAQEPSTSRQAPTIYVGGPAALDVSRAAREAMRRLREPGCQRLFDDLADRDGRPLRESLGASTPAAYLAGLAIREGEIPRGSGRCASPGAAAFTADGAAVFVCGNGFRALSPGGRANALIHEMLHTLGLRENPPSSAEITRWVTAACGA